MLDQSSSILTDSFLNYHIFHMILYFTIINTLLFVCMAFNWDYFKNLVFP